MGAKFYIFGFLFFACFSARGEILLFTAGEPDRGGAGDVAANIFMAQQLRRERPQANLHVMVRPDVQDLLAKLVPRAKDLRTSLEIDGITYHLNGASKPPLADVAFEFASERDPDPLMQANAKKVMRFQEYSGTAQGARVYGGTRKLDGVVGPDLLHPLSAGPGDEEAGLYVSRTVPKAPLTQKQLMTALDALPSSRKGDLAGDYAKTKIGFAYTHSRAVTLAYVEAMAKLASRPENKNQKFLLVVQQDVSMAVVPPNVEVRYYEKIPFELTKAIVAQSALPLMVTGDVSVTLALEYAKPFLYESLAWKTDFAFGLARELKENESFSTAGAHTLMQALTAVDGEQSFNRRLEREQLTHVLFEVISDEATLQQMGKAMIKVKAKRSLPAALSLFLTRLDKLGERGDQNAALVLRHAIEGRPLSDTKTEIAALNQPNREIKKKVDARPEFRTENTPPAADRWSRDPRQIAEEILAVAPALRRPHLEKLASDAPAAVKLAVVLHLKHDEVAARQIHTIPRLREFLACGVSALNPSAPPPGAPKGS